MTDPQIDKWLSIYEKKIDKYIKCYEIRDQQNPPLCFPTLRQQILRVEKRESNPFEKGRPESSPYLAENTHELCHKLFYSATEQHITVFSGEAGDGKTTLTEDIYYTLLREIRKPSNAVKPTLYPILLYFKDLANREEKNH